MQNDDYILFEHNLTIFDLKNLFIIMICSLFLLCFCSLFLGFNIASVLQIQPVLVSNLYYFCIVLGIIFIITALMLRFSTFAKIILTEDKIIYKPPISVKIYEMQYSCVKSFGYTGSILIVSGAFGQKLNVYLSKKTANKIIGILKKQCDF